MKNKSLFFLLSSFVAGTFSCSSNDPVDDFPGKAEISMQSRVNSVTAGTRGDGVITQDFQSDLSVKFVRIDEAPSYPADYSACAAKAATINAGSKILKFTPAEYYLENDGKTKLLGWYPATGTLNSADGEVTFADVDGSTDIMLTPLAEGSAIGRFGTVTFSHVLTQISVQAYATSDDAREVWGGIESVIVKEKKQSCTIGLPATGDAAETTATVSFGTAADLPLVKRNVSDNSIVKGKDLSNVYNFGNPLQLGSSDGKSYCGYAMFAPNADDTDLLLEIKTEKGGVQTVTISQAFNAGTSYAVSLKFDSDYLISSSATIAEWQQGNDIGDIGINKPDSLAQALAYKEVNDLQQTYSLFYKPMDGWVGDPMPFYENGEYYVFYLHDARDGAPTFHPWNMVRTTDFNTYAERGLMIPCGAEDTPEKALGTGSVFHKDGTYYAFYTGHNGDVWPRERILMATSTDLENWTKQPSVDIRASDGYDANEFRDPILFFDENSNNYKMLISSRSDVYSSPEWTSVLAQYKSDDLLNWTLDAPFYNGGSSYMVECPDVFIWGGYQYLIYSDIDDRMVHYKYRAVGAADWIVPALSALDNVAFYAGKTAGDGTNRYLFGWCPTRVASNDDSNYSWAGSLVVHRLLQNPDGTLDVDIPGNIVSGLGNLNTLEALKLQNASTDNGQYVLTGGESKAVAVFPRFEGTNRILATIKPETATRFGIEFAAYESQNYVYDLVIDTETQELRLDYKLKQNKLNTLTTVPLPAPIDGKYEVSVVVENSVCVAYVNGKVALTNRIYRMAENPWAIFAEGGDATFSVELYK